MFVAVLRLSVNNGLNNNGVELEISAVKIWYWIKWSEGMIFVEWYYNT